MVDKFSELSDNNSVSDIFARAIDQKASDIHIEPQRDIINIRFRVNGLLYIVRRLPKAAHESVISRIKILSKLDITVRHLPQDGHFEFSHNNKIYNIRVSTFPTIYGEVVVMRILTREDLLIDVNRLGFDKTQLSTVLNLISQPFGIMLITGPSGSGKTTFLYSILNYLNKTTFNIITVEDPIELQMEGMRQTQVNNNFEFNFAKAMKAILRQDPDIIMIGEIRDNETAQIAMQAALTGKLVFSTFHTLNFFGVIARLIEMEVPRSVIANAIVGITSARLVRTICNNCKVPYTLSDEEKRLFTQYQFPTQLFIGRGCEQCFKSGYSSRTGIFEVIPFDDEIKSLIIEKGSFNQFTQILKNKKVKSLRESAIDKIISGETTMAEVIRVTGKPL